MPTAKFAGHFLKPSSLRLRDLNYPRRLPRLGQYLFHNLSLHIGQPEIATLVAECEFFVIETEQVEERGLEIVDLDFVPGNAEAEFVGFAEYEPFFDARAGQENRKAIGIMVAAKDFAAGGAAFAKRSAAKFAAPDDQR